MVRLLVNFQVYELLQDNTYQQDIKCIPFFRYLRMIPLDISVVLLLFLYMSVPLDIKNNIYVTLKSKIAYVEFSVVV